MNRTTVLALTLALFGGAFATTPAYSLDKETDMEIRRMDSRLSRVGKLMESLRSDVRQLQRSNEKVLKKMEYMDGKMSTMTDQMVRIENVDLSNLRVGQKGLYDQIPTFTWGEDTENCDDIKTEHQQTNSVKSKDGLKTLRYLCFDGKAIHLGTEYHAAPK